MTRSNSRRASKFELIHLLRIAGLFLVLFTFANNMNAQSALLASPEASISVDGIISLPANQPLSDKYLFDLSHLNFENETAMVEFFSEKGGENYFIRPLPLENKAVLYLKCSSKPNWSCSDWNSHLQQEMLANPIKL